MARRRPEGSSFVTLVERGEKKTDDLLYKVTVRNLRRNIARRRLPSRARGPVRQPAGDAAPAPDRCPRCVPQVPLFRDILVTNMEYLLAT